MLENQVLSELATKQCHAHAHRRVTGDLIVSTNSEQTDWDAFQATHFYTQSMTIWRRYARFDIIVDSKGGLVGFIDHEKYANPGDYVLGREQAEALIRDAGVVPASAKLEDYSSITPPAGAGKIWKAVFALARPETEYELLDVEINAALRTVVAVRPKRRGGARA
ncbi:MAG: hypothetical protein ABIW76_03730 [Fibrobacteria bacterium]